MGVRRTMLVRLGVGWALVLLGFEAGQDLENFFLGVGCSKIHENFNEIFGLFFLKK